MNLWLPHNLPGLVYQAFIHDGRRLYRLLPGSLRRGFWLVFIAQVLSALAETSTLLVISLFALSVAAPEAVLKNFLVRTALDLAPALKPWFADPRRLLAFTSLLMTVFIVFKAGLSILVQRQTALFAESVSFHIGRETLGCYLSQSYFWHISPESRAVMLKFGQRGRLTQFLRSLLLLYCNVICCLALFACLFLVEPKLTLLVGAAFGLCSLGVYMGLRPHLDTAAQKALDLNLAEKADRRAMSQSLREVYIYRRQAIMFEKMVATMAAGRPMRAFLAFSGSLPSQALGVIGFATISLLTICLLAQGQPLPVIVSSISLLMLTAWRVLPAVSRILGYIVSLRSLRPAALSCLELLENFITEVPEPLPQPDPEFRFEKSLGLEEAGFTYPGSQEPALAGLNLDIKRGEKVGLIGASGVGKSTLALLLTGLVPLQGGRFLVDGQELTPAGRAAYLRLVGYVPQKPLLLPGTVADNVAFSQWGEEYERERLEEVCRRAAMDFVDPQGLDRSLGGLSGGQTQRVAIARALFSRPEIIIFDEATSALDQASENIITETIRQLVAGTTVIIIAHRLSTVENCDRIIWLEEGRVKATGTPSEILPRYRASMEEKSLEWGLCA